MSRAETGRWGEDVAAQYLSEHGYRVIERNFNLRCGEIDIIAATDRYVCFVEVRTRTDGAMVSGLESVDWRKARKVFRTACVWLERNLPDLQPRFDIISVTAEKCVPLTLKRIEHITDAFGAEVCNEIF